MSVVVDALGKQCPIPVVMAKKALAELQTPDTLEILVAMALWSATRIL